MVAEAVAHFLKEAKSAAMNIFRKKIFSFQIIVKVEFSYVSQ